MLRFSAIWAILTALTLAVAEFRANWGEWQWWPWWPVDFVAASALFVGGLATLRLPALGKPWLAAAWAFTLGMAWMSLAANLETGADTARDARLGGAYLLLVGALTGSAFLGLMPALFGHADVQSKA